MARILEETNFLVNSQIELVAHSPLLRAKQTAKGMLGCMAPDIRTHPVVRVEEIDLLTEKTPAEWIPGNYGSFAKRMADLEEWLEKQPEKTVALVGHSQFFKAMLQLDYKFGNCDVMHVQFDARNGNGAPASKWSDLKKIHACKVPEQPETKSIN
jgi:phosphohistidine phosphatase SixA